MVSDVCMYSNKWCFSVVFYYGFFVACCTAFGSMKLKRVFGICSDKKADYDVKVKAVEIIPYPVARGKPASFSISATTGSTSVQHLTF